MVLKNGPAVLIPPDPSCHTSNGLDLSPLMSFQEFVIASIERIGPDVIRISNMHAALFLPIMDELVWRILTTEHDLS